MWKEEDEGGENSGRLNRYITRSKGSTLDLPPSIPYLESQFPVPKQVKNFLEEYVDYRRLFHPNEPDFTLIDMDNPKLKETSSGDFYAQYLADAKIDDPLTIDISSDDFRIYQEAVKVETEA